MSDIRIIVFVLALLTAAPWAMIGAPSAQEQATSQAGPPVEAVREAQALLAGLGYAPGSTGADTWNESLSRAYRAFLRDAGLPTSEMLTPRGLRRLREVARSEGVAAGSGAPGGPAPEPASDGLHRAVMVGDMDGARALLLRGAAVDGRDGRGWTPLMHAAHKGYVLLVEMLLQSGASPDVRAPDGATALFMAVLNGHPEAIALLMRAGASVSVLGPRGLTPADAARLLYGNNQGQRPVPDDAAIHALLAGMTWGDAVKAAVAGRREETNAATSEASLGLDRKTRAHVQRRLSELGFSPGPDDGVFGRRTRLAIGAWQESEGFVRTGYLTRKQTDTLVADDGRTVDQSEAPMAFDGEATQAEAEFDIDEQRVTEKTEQNAVLEESEPEAPVSDTLQDAIAETLSRALSAAEKIDDAYQRSMVLSSAASTQAEVGDVQGSARSIAEALSIAETIDDEFGGPSALAFIAWAQANTGNFGDALSIAERVDGFFGVEAFVSIAIEQAEAGDFRSAQRSISMALSIAERMDDESSRGSAIARIAVAQAEAGDARGAAQSIAAAISIAEKIDDEIVLGRTTVLRDIARAQAATGNSRDALRIAERIDGFFGVHTVVLIAMEQTKAGDVQSAARSISAVLSMADRMDEDNQRAYIVARIAKVQADAGDALGAARSIATALSIVENVDDEFGAASSILIDIAKAQVSAGNLRAALRTAERISGHFGQALALNSIAQIQFRLEDSIPKNH